MGFLFFHVDIPYPEVLRGAAAAGRVVQAGVWGMVWMPWPSHAVPGGAAWTAWHGAARQGMSWHGMPQRDRA